MWHCCFGGLKLVTVDSIIFGFILTHGCSVEEEEVSMCLSLPHCLNIHKTSQSGLIFSHCNLGLGSKPILSWIAAVSGFTYTGATSTIGDEPKRLCLAVARLASISAFSWLYSDISSILSSILVGVLRIISTVYSAITLKTRFVLLKISQLAFGSFTSFLLDALDNRH